MQTKGAIPPLRYYSGMTRIENRLIVFGGKTHGLSMQNNTPVPTKNFLNDVYVLDLGVTTWYKANNVNIPSPRSLHCFLAFKKHIYMIGGGKYFLLFFVYFLFIFFFKYILFIFIYF